MKKYRREILSVLLMIIIGTMMLLWGTNSSLDAQFYYTGESAKHFLSSLTESQNRTYFRHEILDLGFIFSYTLFYFFLVRRTFTSDHYQWLAFVPGFFDLIETTSILYFLNSKALPGTLEWLGPMTSLKWLSVAALSFILVLALRKSKPVE